MKNLTELTPNERSQKNGELTPWEQIEALREKMYESESTSFRRLYNDEDLFENGGEE
jgi:hypothetical protein